jgi:hypothetical protein
MACRCVVASCNTKQQIVSKPNDVRPVASVTSQRRSAYIRSHSNRQEAGRKEGIQDIKTQEYVDRTAKCVEYTRKSDISTSGCW